MRGDVLKYEKVYQIIKNKIECGLLKKGERLPSRGDLCKEFNTSEKTIRRALDLLSRDGLIETEQRKRPLIAGGISPSVMSDAQQRLQRTDCDMMSDTVKTGILLCYPIVRKGMELCSGSEWKIPESIVDQMEPDCPTEFWRLSNRFWRFFIARLGNELILRAVDSLGFDGLDPLPGTLEIRTKYLHGIRKMLQTVKNSGGPERVYFEDLSPLYSFLSGNEDGGPSYLDASGSAPQIKSENWKGQFRKAEERYSRVYLDLIGLISLGYYQPGDKLPTHKQLQIKYGVSVDTTMKAIQALKKWGVVTTKRNGGIFVTMGLKELKEIQLPEDLIACHLRRMLDSMEMLSLIAEDVAVHAGALASEDDVLNLCNKIDSLWKGNYEYQLAPIVLLEFLKKHIHYDALRSIYQVLEENFYIGRCIPNLVKMEKTERTVDVYEQCKSASKALADHNVYGFAKSAAGMYQAVYQMIVKECKKLGYWEAAYQVYDGSELWK